jgi:23S rRNA-intervening sequence protein
MSVNPTFEDLEVYETAREFRRAMYAIAKRLPGLERFRLADQVRRAAVSLTNNIAKGHRRSSLPGSNPLYVAISSFNRRASRSFECLLTTSSICQARKFEPKGTGLACSTTPRWSHSLFTSTDERCDIAGERGAGICSNALVLTIHDS